MRVPVTLDLGSVVHEAVARWRRDRALLWPLAGLLLLVPQWAMALFVPEAPAFAGTASDAAAMNAWAAQAQAWAQANGPLYIAAFLLAQWGQLALMALYVVPGDRHGERPTVGRALAQAARLLARFVLAELLVSMPLGAAALLAASAGPLLILAIPAILYVLGRTLLVGPAILARRGTGAAAAVLLSWRWSRGSGGPLALVAAALMLGAPLIVHLVRAAAALSSTTRLGDQVVLAALDGIAAAIAAAAMLALAMCAGVLYRRLAR